MAGHSRRFEAFHRTGLQMRDQSFIAPLLSDHDGIAILLDLEFIARTQSLPLANLAGNHNLALGTEDGCHVAQR